MKKKLPIKSAYLLPTYDCIFKYLSSACIIQWEEILNRYLFWIRANIIIPDLISVWQYIQRNWSLLFGSCNFQDDFSSQLTLDEE